MPSFGPIKRLDLISALREAGFDGPFTGGKHQFIERDDLATAGGAAG